MKNFVLHFVALVSSSVAVAYTPVLGESQSADVQPGVWNARFYECKAFAESNELPLVVFWAASGCSQCEKLEEAVKNSDFTSWMKDRGYVMNFVMGNNPYKPADAKKFAKKGLDYFSKMERSIGDYPYIAVYFKNESGEYVKYNFTGRAGGMPSTKGSLQQQFMDSVDLILTEWKKPITYTGGNFLVSGTNATHRLEAVLGKTTSVAVPLYRKNAESPSTNTLKVVFETVEKDSQKIEWAANESNKIVNVSTAIEGAGADSNIVLELFDDTGTNKVDSSSITLVEDQATSVHNPKWIGEEFGFGEWTMDLDAALSKATEAEGMRTLVLSTGALWCPFCKSLEEKVLSDPEFIAWATTNKVNLVVLDNPKRSADDIKDDNGALVSVGKAPNGAPPSLLRYEADAEGVSGAAYISRKGLSVEDAEPVLQRNHDILYQGGNLCAPETLRTGYPTLILVNSDGTAAGRLLDGVDMSSRSWGLSVDETIDRLNELLLLAGRNEKASKPSTTEESMPISAETVSGELQVNNPVAFYRLTDVPNAEVLFEVESGTNLTLTVYETDSTLAKAKVLKRNQGVLSLDLTSSTNKFIAVSIDVSDNLKSYGSNTTVGFSLKSSCILKPAESKSEFTSQSDEVNMSLEEGVQYKLTGFSSLEGVEEISLVKDDIYEAKKTGVCKLPVALGDTVSYQIWTPGVIAFSANEYRFLESSVTGLVKVVRSAGGSGAAKVKVYIADLGSLDSARYEWSDVELEWADGEKGEKIVRFVMNVDPAYAEEAGLSLGLTALEGCSASVSTNLAAVVVFDSDDPCFTKSSYTINLFNGFGVADIFETANIDSKGTVKLKKTVGSLPSGVSIKYNKTTQMVELSGTPKKSGDYTATYTITQNGETGVEATIKINVQDPTAYNAFIGKKYSNKEVLLYAAYGSDSEILAGKLIVNISAANKITARYTGTDKKAVSLSGQWTSLDVETGVASTSIVGKNGVALDLELTKDGVLRVKRLVGVVNDFGDEFTGELLLAPASFADFAGYYTVALPANVSGGEDIESAGTGYLTLSMISSKDAAAGKMKFSGMLGNGASINGTSYLVKDTVDENYAYLPIFIRSGKEMLSAVLSISNGGATCTDLMDMRVVCKADNVIALQSHREDGYNFDVQYLAFGSYYTQKTTLDSWCAMSQVLNYDMSVDFAKEGNLPCTTNSIYGAPVLGDSAIIETAGSKIKITNLGETILTKISFTPKTGIFTGSVKIPFADGRTRSGSLKGVLLPGWNLGCGECSDLPELAFAVGTVYYSDSVPGIVKGRNRNIKIARGVSFELHAAAISYDETGETE